MSTINEWKYYPKPTFTNINEDGEISLEWVNGVGNRLTLIFDTSRLDGESESNLYAIYTGLNANGKIEQELFCVHGPSDIVRGMKMIGLEPE